MLQQIPHHQHPKMHRRPLPLRQPVVPVRIGHVVEGLPKLHQTVHQSLRDLQVRVRFPGSVNDEQIPLQPFGVVDGSRDAVSRPGSSPGFPCRSPGTMRCIGAAGAWRHGNPHVVDIGLSEQGVQGVRSAAAPPPDPHSGQIDVGEDPAELPDSRRVLLRRLHADCRKGRPPPRRALRCRGAPVLDRHDQVPEVRDGAMVAVPGRPPVQHGLAVRFP